MPEKDSQLSHSEKVALLTEIPTSDYVRAPRTAQVTARVQVNGDTARVETDIPGHADPGMFEDYLAEQGLDPADWEVTGYRTSRWTMPGGDEGTSVKLDVKRRRGAAVEAPPVDELLHVLDSWQPSADRAIDLRGDTDGIVLALGDMQIGKGPAGTVEGDGENLSDILEMLWMAALEIKHRSPQRVVIAWLGDHVEGFESQGGANTWRTQTPLTEQIRIVRRIMLRAVEEVVARYAGPVTCVAVPGNHGEAVRVGGKGVTRYDDSHDTEALIQVADICARDPRLDHVEFLVPDTDELTVVHRMGDTVLGFAHGHKWRPGKHFEWWRGQAFHDSPLSDATILFAGHLHHLVVEVEGRRTFVQVPSTEPESTWFRHATGVGGDSSILLVEVDRGLVRDVGVVRPWRG